MIVLKIETNRRSQEYIENTLDSSSGGEPSCLCVQKSRYSTK